MSSPSTPPSAADVNAKSAPQQMVTESLEFLASVTRYNQWMCNTLEPYVGQRLLELGCGTGNMLQHFLLKEHLIGLDLDPALIDYCRDLFRHHSNCEFHCADIFQDEVEFAVQPDTVVSANVLEHIEDDRGALAWMARQLPKGGRLAILVPAHPLIYGEIDRAAGHFRRYTKRDLVAKIKDAGFRVEASKHFNTIGFFGWGLNSRLLGRRHIPVRQTLVYDRYVAPLQSWFETIFPPLFGQSLIVAARKL